MAGSVNKVILIGNLGKDPESRSMQDGNKVVNLSVATSESWKDPHSGDKRERTEWHRVVIFNDGLGKLAEQFLKKGAKIMIEGKLSTRKWQDQGGNERTTTEIVLAPYSGLLTFLETRRGTSGERAPSGQGTGDWADEAPD